jgi:xylulokinase
VGPFAETQTALSASDLAPYTFEGENLPPLLWCGGRGLAVEGGKSLFLPSAAYFARNEPRLYEKTKYLFSAQERLSFSLGAEPVSILPSSRYEDFYWNKEQCALFGVDPAKFPPFVPMGSIIGAVSEKAAQRFSLKKGAPIIASGPDFITALIGTGTLKKGIVCDRAGTSEGVNLCADFHSAQNLHGLRVLPHIAEGLWNVGGIIPRSGSLFDQYRAEHGFLQRDYGGLLREIMKEKNEGFSVLRKMALQVKATLDLFRENGFSISEMRASGGQAKSRLWNRLKADLIGCTLVIPEIADGELAGNACLAAVALGEARDLEDAAARFFRVKETYEPASGAD